MRVHVFRYSSHSRNFWNGRLLECFLGFWGSCTNFGMLCRGSAQPPSSFACPRSSVVLHPPIHLGERKRCAPGGPPDFGQKIRNLTLFGQFPESNQQLRCRNATGTHLENWNGTDLEVSTCSSFGPFSSVPERFPGVWNHRNGSGWAVIYRSRLGWTAK